MTRIDFYQISPEEKTSDFCCRLISKIWRHGHEIYVHTPEADTAKEIDELLWSFRPESFIPHGLLKEEGDSEPTPSPVEIGFLADPGRHKDVLINFSENIPDFFSRFERVAEIVPFEEEKRTVARKNYQFYKDRGYPLHYHKLDSRTKGNGQ